MDVTWTEVVLRRNDTFARYLARCEGVAPIPCAVVHPCDRDSLLGPVEAWRRGLIEPVLVGPEHKIRAVAEGRALLHLARAEADPRAALRAQMIAAKSHDRLLTLAAGGLLVQLYQGQGRGLEAAQNRNRAERVIGQLAIRLPKAERGRVMSHWRATFGLTEGP